MEKDTVCIKIVPLSPIGPKRCGVCDELLVIPPIYSCKSVPYICGPCFEGYRYYLDDDELRAADYPVRQILYENIATKCLFFCSYYPHCQGRMAFNHEARLHYREYCIAKVFWIFKCPISRANRWFLRPDQHYCGWRFTRLNLYDNEIEKLMRHLRFLHSEYILEKPHVLNLKDLIRHDQKRQLFLLSLMENGIIAVLMTEITKTDIIFRCRVSDPEWLSRTKDPYECCITLIPPHERFRSIVDLKFDCLPLDSNETECPWNSIRFPLRHLIAETSFQINVFPRSVMLEAVPYLHRYRQLNNIIEDGSNCPSEGTLSNPDSLRTDSEVLSIPSTISDDQIIDYTGDGYPEILQYEDLEQESSLSKKVCEHIDFNQCPSNKTITNKVCGKVLIKRSTASVFCNRPVNDENKKITETVRQKSSTSRRLDMSHSLSSSEPISSVASSNLENLQDVAGIIKDTSKETNTDYVFDTVTNVNTLDDDNSSNSSSDIDPILDFKLPSPVAPEQEKNYEKNEELDCQYLLDDDAFLSADNEYQKSTIFTSLYENYLKFGLNYDAEDFELTPISSSDLDNSPPSFKITPSIQWENKDNNRVSDNNMINENVVKDLQTTNEMNVSEKTTNLIVESSAEIPGRKSSLGATSSDKIFIRQLKNSSSEGDLTYSILALDDSDQSSSCTTSSNSADSSVEFETTSPEAQNDVDLTNISSPTYSNKKCEQNIRVEESEINLCPLIIATKVDESISATSEQKEHAMKEITVESIIEKFSLNMDDKFQKETGKKKELPIVETEMLTDSNTSMVEEKQL